MPYNSGSGTINDPWKYGDNGSVKTNANTLYNTENSWTDIVDAKIVLMYLHDYYYAYQSGGVNCSGSGPYGNCKTSWIHLSVCDSEAPSTTEWTMSQHETSNYVWAIHSSGYSYDGIVNSERSVRPVFFLTSSVKYISGSGTATDPFIIS